MTPAEPVLATPALLRDWPLPDPGSDKRSRGHLLVLGGTATTPGAVRLAGEAALRAGAGKLAMFAPEQHASALGVTVPEGSVTGLPTEDGGSLAAGGLEAVLDRAIRVDAALVGPGFTAPGAAERLLAGLVPRMGVPLVVDALATAYLTAHPDGLHHLAGRAVVTANPAELAAMVDHEEPAVAADPTAWALEAARRLRAVVLCGSTDKHVAAPDGRCWLVPGGGPGLGVSGSGDVQAGIVAGLLARGAAPVRAAVWGGWLHGRAGARLAAEVGTLGFLAREVADRVPHALAELDGEHPDPHERSDP